MKFVIHIAGYELGDSPCPCEGAELTTIMEGRSLDGAEFVSKAWVIDFEDLHALATFIDDEGPVLFDAVRDSGDLAIPLLVLDGDDHEVQRDLSKDIGLVKFDPNDLLRKLDDEEGDSKRAAP